MTLCSFIDVRPPASWGADWTLMCTTVSTSCPVITLAITGLRMSARTNETGPRSSRGGTVSTPMTRSIPGAAAIRRANRPPKSRETPVTSTTRPTSAVPDPGAVGLLALAATLDARLLQELAVLLLRHALASLLDYRTHYTDLPGLHDGPGPTYWLAVQPPMC